MPGSCYFNESWLEKAEYKKWLRKHHTDKRQAFCSLCKKSISLSAMGEGALTSHKKGKVHQRNESSSSSAVCSIQHFCSARTTATEGASTSQSASSSAAQPTTVKDKGDDMTSYATKTDVLKSELLWAMKCVDSHYSMNSCAGIGNLFQHMFPDSVIAQRYASADKKTAYLCTKGLGPYFSKCLSDKVQASSSYTLLFDETLNHDMQQKQMDIYVRIWDVNRVKTFYFDSQFLGHATAEDMFEQLNPLITKLGHRKLVQLSMDGPSVNWKLYRLLCNDINRSTPLQLLETGSCGLHVMHNAFRSGCAASGWDIEGFLSSVYHLFHDAPARMDDFLTVAKAPVKPLKFCRHRWLENIEPAERAITLLPHLVSFCSAAKNKSVNTPSCKSFKEVMRMLGDPLLKAELQFFVAVATDIQPFLKAYQTDSPMISFLSSDIGILIKDLMLRFVKRDVVDGAKSVYTLSQIKYKDAQNQVGPSKIDVGVGASFTLRSTQAGIADKDRYTFKLQCRDFLVAVLEKVLEKSPVTYRLVRSLTWLDPRLMSSSKTKDRSTVASQLQTTLSLMKDYGQLATDAVGETIKKQYNHFCDWVISEESSVFHNFNPTSDRVDELLHLHLNNKKNYSELWDFMKKLLILSHGQATVERGFSINKQTSVENLKTESLVARRMILEHVRHAGCPTNVPITKEMLCYASSARSAYENSLLEQKKTEEAAAMARKRKAEDAELSSLKKRRQQLADDVAYLVETADKKALEAEQKASVPLIKQSNALRSRAEMKRKELKELDEKLSKDQVKSL